MFQRDCSSDLKNSAWNLKKPLHIFFPVLVDTRDREGAQITYVVQENIEVIKSAKVLHPKVDDHFEAYDGSQYIPRPWLRELYPLD